MLFRQVGKDLVQPRNDLRARRDHALDNTDVTRNLRGAEGHLFEVAVLGFGERCVGHDGNAEPLVYAGHDRADGVDLGDVVGDHAQLTPPLGIILFVVASATSEVKVEEVVKGTMPFFAIILLFLALMVAFPEIALFLPELTFG